MDSTAHELSRALVELGLVVIGLAFLASHCESLPLSPKNLHNRVLAPACDAICIPLVWWHSFRHSNATILGEVGESLKPAQAILGRSDLETTLNTYAR